MATVGVVGKQRHTTIEPIIDARSQFVAFASSWIERCGVGSAAKSLSHNRALCESFGRDWVVGCCKEVGTTITVARNNVNVCVFIGLSATLGVAWCRSWSDDDDDDECAVSGRIVGTAGDGKFVCSTWGCAKVIDSSGNVTATIDSYADYFWRSNRKWLVKFTAEKNLVAWRMTGGGRAPSGVGVCVPCTVPLDGLGARFSPFDPCGDELVVVGMRAWYVHEPRASLVSFIDMERTVAAGVTVKARESVLVPGQDPFDLLWASPDTILTVHGDSSSGGPYRVYNSATGQELRAFPSRTHDLVGVSSGHIVLVRKDLGVCEVYSASSGMSKPSCSYRHNPLLNRCSSSDEVYVAISEDNDSSSTWHDGSACIHYTTTGTPLARLWIMNTP